MSAPQRPDISRLATVRADGGRVAIHPADVRGRFITRRRAVFALLLAFYVAAPLVKLDGRPLVHLDVASRKFFLFGATFNAQDFWIVLFLLTTFGFGLLFVTAWLGRVWCGWACPQTVFLEGIFRPIERFFDGPREKRLRAALQPLTVRRALRAVAKHAAYLLAASFLTHVALSLFVTAWDLLAMVRDGPFAHPVAFTWSAVVTGLLYFNFAWFREQLCVIVCPYGRLQSVLTDRDSLIVGYDAARGEPRGRAGTTSGSCVDCHRCVQVCPTGIDIRQGLQMECLTCAQCVEACDEVMDKLHRPRGLIRYDSAHGLAGQPRRVLRPRLFAYAGLAAASLIALTSALILRSPFEANLLRARGVPWTAAGDGLIRNQFELHLVNKSSQKETYEISVAGPPTAQIVLPRRELHIESLESVRLPFFVSAQSGEHPGGFGLEVLIRERRSGAERTVQARFLGPRG